MLIAIATGIRTITRVVNWRATQPFSISISPALLYGARPGRMNGCRALTACQVRRATPDVPPVRDRFARGEPPAQLHIHGDWLRPDQRRVQGRREGQRVVDEGAVEAVVAAVELHVEAEGIGQISHQPAIPAV